LAGDLKSAIGFFLRLRQHPVALTEQLLSLLHFFGDGNAHLVNNIEHTVFIHHHVTREWDGLALIE
jgi:hypothetical protein